MSNYNQPRSESMGYQPTRNSYLDNFSKKDKIWSLIGILFLIGSIDGGPPAFIGIFILGCVFYSVSQRERAKGRILNVLTHEPNTTVSYIANQIDKSEDYVTEVLKIMILDEGAPIRFDLINKTVKKVGEFYGSAQYQPPRPATYGNERHTNEREQTNSRQTVHEEPQEDTSRTVSPSSQDTQSQVQMVKRDNCIHCGIELPSVAKFCHECGVRQAE